MRNKITDRCELDREPSGSHSARKPTNASLKARAPALRACAVILLLTLAACASPAPDIGEPGPNGGPPPIPVDGPIAYRCSDGTQLMVEADGRQARVAIVGGPSMVLPSAGDQYYSNGRYGFRGGGASGQWEVGRAAPVNCTGS